MQQLKSLLQVTGRSQKVVLKVSIFLSFTGIVVGVEIKDMRVPQMIESGSEPHVVLDCDYDLRDSEGKDDGILNRIAQVIHSDKAW